MKLIKFYAVCLYLRFGSVLCSVYGILSLIYLFIVSYEKLISLSVVFRSGFGGMGYVFIVLMMFSLKLFQFACL